MTAARRLRLALVAGLLIAAGPAALAQTNAGVRVPIGTFQDWGAVYDIDNQGRRICLVASAPRTSTPQVSGRGDAYLVITYWPGGTRGEVMIKAGYNFRSGSTVTLTVGSSTYNFFTQAGAPDTAWIENQAQEAALVNALRAGANATVRGTNTAGTTITDTFSLFGVTDALNAIGQQCPA